MLGDRYVIRLLSLASDGIPIEPETYVLGGDANYVPPGERLRDRCGTVFPTTDLDQAMTFARLSDAVRWMETQSSLMPRRPDGKPNRPFTAYNTEFIPVSVLMRDRARN